jgi:hypothetical protein
MLTRTRVPMPSSPRSRFAAAVSLTALAGALFAAAASSSHATRHIAGPGTTCGGKLWRLLTLSDAARATVKLHGEPTTIAKIAALTPPRRITRSRSTAFQRQVWRLHTIVDRYRIASNGEIVLELFDVPTSTYMNAYMPNPKCLSKATRGRAAILAARTAFTKACPAASAAWQPLGATARLTGVGFWNPVRTTKGALTNGAELRPITGFALMQGCGKF